jgi:hypothetical protein
MNKFHKNVLKNSWGVIAEAVTYSQHTTSVRISYTVGCNSDHLLPHMRYAYRLTEEVMRAVC